MMSELEARAQRRLDLFLSAVEIADPDEQAGFLHAQCGDDSALRRDVESLLAADRRNQGLLEQPAWLVSSQAAAALETPPSAAVDGGLGPAGETASASGQTSLPQIPGYEIIGLLARGGMGVVYQARHLALNRLVALKLILAGRHASQHERARFRAEAEALARVQHPNIVQVFEIGEHDGLPFLSLEFVDGQSLDKKSAGTPQNPRAAAQLVSTLAQAVHIAHQAGIIHRDLKPANVLIAGPVNGQAAGRGLESDKPGVAAHSNSPAFPQSSTDAIKITDFGLAKMQDAADGPTRTGDVMGTPSYMSPEQAAGRTKEIGAATDIYALGAILYEMLTGRPPFKADSTLETVRQVVEGDPVAPVGLQPRIPRDLDTICLKCLQKQPKKRYATAQELAEDLNRFLRGEPIKARPAGWVERGGKWVKRHPAWSSAAALLVAATVGSLLLADWAWAERAEAIEARRRADANLAKAEEEKKKADLALALSNLQHYSSQIARAHNEWEAHRPIYAWFHLERTPPELRGLEYDYLRGLFQENQTILRGHEKPTAVAFSPDGKQLASASQDGVVRMWDVEKEKEVGVLPGHAGHVLCLAFTADGKSLLGASKDGTVWACSGDVKKKLFDLKVDGDLLAAAFSPDRKRLATGASEGTVTVWDVDQKKKLCGLEGHSDQVGDRRRVLGVAFSPDGKRLASAGWDRSVRLWDGESRKLLHTFASAHGDWVNAVSFSPDGKRLASASDDHIVRLWDTDKLSRLQDYEGHSNFVFAVAFSHDGNQLASASHDGTVRVWDANNAKALFVLKGHIKPVVAVAFSPDGKLVASASEDRTVRLWPLRDRQEPLFRIEDDYVLPLAFSADGKLLVGRADDRTLRLCDVEKRKVTDVLRGHEKPALAAAFSANGKRLASGSESGRVRLWDVATGDQLAVLTGHTAKVTAVAFNQDGHRLASGSYDNTVRLWEVGKKGEELVLTGHTNEVCCVAFSPDGNRLASASRDKTVRLWDANKAMELFVLAEDTHEFVAVAFSPDGKLLASASDTTIRLWDVEKGQELLGLKGHTKGLLALAFSPDGKRLASASHDTTVRLWELTNSVETLLLRGHGAKVSTLGFSRDGRRLLSASWNSTVGVWNAPRPPA